MSTRFGRPLPRQDIDRTAAAGGTTAADLISICCRQQREPPEGYERVLNRPDQPNDSNLAERAFRAALLSAHGVEFPFDPFALLFTIWPLLRKCSSFVSDPRHQAFPGSQGVTAAGDSTL